MNEIRACSGELQELFDQFFGGDSKPARKPPTKNNRSKKTGTASSDDEIISKAESVSSVDSATKFRRLFHDGDTSGYPSGSEADLALCCQLAFWTRDPGQIDRLFRQSSLMRDKWDREDYRTRTIAAALETVTVVYDPTKANDKLNSHVVGRVEIVPAPPRQTRTKVIVPIEIRVDGEPKDSQELTTAISNRVSVVKAIVDYAGERHTDAVKRAVAAILLEARGLVNTGKPAGSTIRELLSLHIPEQVKLRYVTAKGRAYSEALGKEISRNQFTERMGNNSILDLIAIASDVPRLGDGQINRPSLISLLEKELRLLWGDLIDKLPVGDHEPFEDVILRLWKRPKGMSIVKQQVPSIDGSESVQLMSSTSLAARACEIFATHKTWELTPRWVQIQRGYEAYLRLTPMPDGTHRKLLAMRYELADQVGVPLPDVTSQKRFNSLGETFGVVDPTPPVSNKTSDGTKWLAVLMHHITDQILYVPVEDAPVTDENDGR